MITRPQPQQAPPLSFQDLMGLFSMLNNQSQQGLQGVNQMQEFQQRQQEQPFRQQILQNQAQAPQMEAMQAEEKAKQDQTAMILQALGQIRPAGLGEVGGNQAAILDALQQKFGFNSQAPMTPQPDPMAKWNELINQ